MLILSVPELLEKHELLFLLFQENINFARLLSAAFISGIVCSAKFFKIKQFGIEQVRRNNTAEGSEHVITEHGDFSAKIMYQIFYAPALQVRLRAAHVAGDDGIAHQGSELFNFRFAAVGKGADNGIAVIIAS